MIEEGSKRGKAMVEKRQLFMEMSEWSRPRENLFFTIRGQRRSARVILRLAPSCAGDTRRLTRTVSFLPREGGGSV